ncbi:MAG: hypothetical protein JWO52_1585 [Gammaproteobacteria bacterium]|nr:hypothetical protein [Gammaproteobacteria bacterium]
MSSRVSYASRMSDSTPGPIALDETPPSGLLGRMRPPKATLAEHRPDLLANKSTAARVFAGMYRSFGHTACMSADSTRSLSMTKVNSPARKCGFTSQHGSHASPAPDAAASLITCRSSKTMRAPIPRESGPRHERAKGPSVRPCRTRLRDVSASHANQLAGPAWPGRACGRLAQEPLRAR